MCSSDLPAHNEASRILPYLRAIRDTLSVQSRSYEIIVVDDGSRDDMNKVVREFAKTEPNLRLIPLPTCVGKGGAVRQGMLAARGRLQLFADADGATAITELDRLEHAIRNGADIAIGSRSLAARQQGFTHGNDQLAPASPWRLLQYHRPAGRDQRNRRHPMRIQVVQTVSGSGSFFRVVY